MKERVVIVTGSGGLVGRATAEWFMDHKYHVVGIDNDTRGHLFGPDGSVEDSIRQLQERYPSSYAHHQADVRHAEVINEIVHSCRKSLVGVVHTAGQPSHDWAASHAQVDMQLNLESTLCLLEAVRWNAPEAAFVYLSTNKVYGDFPNTLYYQATESRWDLDKTSRYYQGFDEQIPIDQVMHSLFGCSKAAADLYVQEYGRYFGIPTACFRCGCITGEAHRGVRLHGFLSYLAYCIHGREDYTILGYGGRQVRDNLHANDLAWALWEFIEDPKVAAVYNMGGGRENSCSVLEAVKGLTGVIEKSLTWKYSDEARKGDHIWWISDTSKFERDYPRWDRSYSLEAIYRSLAKGE